MTKKERAEFVAKELKHLFPNPPIPLDHTNTYTLLIAVLLSAQCTDKKVNETTPALFSKAENPYDMVKLSPEEIQGIIRSIGFSNQKSKNIHRLSELLIERHGGEVPGNLEDLEALPGVGHKTASVVMCQAFHKAAFPVDTHIHRLAQMWKFTNGKHVEQTEKDLKTAFPEKIWNKLHLQFIYYGREVCPARNCDGLGCPMCKQLFPARRTPFKAKKA